ncbi:atp-dependent rna helicase [Moniliophthora roreri]|nr:atp-dependent rna helicase [Moniliophthora roreri]
MHGYMDLPQRGNSPSYLFRSSTSPTFTFTKYNYGSFLASSGTSPCTMDEIKNVPRFVDNEYMLDRWGEIKATREERGCNKDFGSGFGSVQADRST